MKFVEYTALRPWGELVITNKVEEDPEHPGVCIVSHPAAGGQCEEPTVYAVYGMLFCEAHGLEAGHAALSELYQSGVEELARPNNPHVPAPNPATLDVLVEGTGELLKKGNAHEEAGDAAAMKAYPEIPERINWLTTRWSPEDDRGGELPHDFWEDERRLILKLMRVAHEEWSVRMVEKLEPYREEATAQAVFAKADYRRKTGRPEEPADC